MWSVRISSFFVLLLLDSWDIFCAFWPLRPRNRGARSRELNWIEMYSTCLRRTPLLFLSSTSFFPLARHSLSYTWLARCYLSYGRALRSSSPALHLACMAHVISRPGSTTTEFCCHSPPPHPHSMQFTTQMSSCICMFNLLFSWAIVMLNPNFLPGPIQLAPRMRSWILPVQFATQWRFYYAEP